MAKNNRKQGMKYKSEIKAEIADMAENVARCRELIDMGRCSENTEGAMIYLLARIEALRWAIGEDVAEGAEMHL
jgi:hypothetical protein